MTIDPGAVTATADAVRSGQASAVAAVSSALDRIAQRNPLLNAVVAVREQAALEDARRLDATRGQEPPRPLDGVPVLVKDHEDVAGLPTRHGSLLLRDAPWATADSIVPARLRAAGAIVVGKTNLPEFATEGFTDNLLYGATGNPWNLRFSPGGSSGGSAASLACGMVPIATASDGGGSIRIPAGMCGLVGLKPTHGAIGSYPAPDWLDLSTSGPLATTVADLRLLLSVMLGRVDGDPAWAPAPWSVARSTGGRPTRVIVAERTSPLGPLPQQVSQPLHSAATRLGALWDVPVMSMEPEAFFGGSGDPDLDWFTIATAEHVQALGRDWVATRLEAMHPATAAFMEQGLQVELDAYLGARRRRSTYVRRLDELLADGVVLVTPVIATSGWLADGRLNESSPAGMLPPEVYSTAVQNVTGHPAISLPAGLLDNGLPFGMQVTAARWRDDLLLDIAEAWESVYPWPRVAPGYTDFAISA